MNRTLLALSLLLLAPASALAQGPAETATAAATATATATPVFVDPASPRASLQLFLDLSREARHEEAARYLEEGGAEEARRLKAVFDRYIWFEMDKVSPLATGDLADGLPEGVEALGEVPGPTGPERVVMERRDDRWVFPQRVVARVPEWYAGLEGRWLLDLLPPSLLKPGPKELLWWQWIALPIVVLISLILGKVLGWITLRIAKRFASRTETEWDDRILGRLTGPVAIGWAIALAYLVFLPSLALYAPAEAFLLQVLRLLFFAVVFWSIFRTVDVIGGLMLKLPWAARVPAATSLIPLGVRFTKIGVLAIAVVAILSTLGYPVASLIAGLGIGGLAFALAAQKTVENLFGSISIAFDQPFRAGDFVKIEDFVGTVETIGLRSTRIRTLDRTLISIPNGRLADMRTETFAARDRIRLFAVLNLVYETRADQMREILAGLERVLRAHPKIWPDAVVVRFRELAAHSLDIEVMAWFLTSDWNEFTAIRQDVLLQFMDVVEKAGSGFAFPTRTIHLADPAGALAKAS